MPTPKSSSSQRSIRAVRLLGVFVLLIGAYLVGFSQGMRDGNTSFLKALLGGDQSSQATFAELNDVWSLLQREYVGVPIDRTKAVYGAIRGLVESLGDPYTVFLTPEEAAEFQEEIDGAFEGIGTEIGIKDDRLVVIAPLPDSPAERAGLVAGDWIQAIDGDSTEGMLLDDAISRIRGAEGTTVVLTLARNDEEPREVSIVREKITVESVTHEKLADGFDLFTISYFGPETGQEFSSAVSAALVAGTRGIILDLRNNPGGYLEESVKVAAEFLAEGQSVVIERFADGTETPYPVDGSGQLGGIPAIVLVNGGSASASEIVAGALQDYDVATILGTTTYGKGTVQQLETLEQGASLKLSVAAWLTPLGRSINDAGIVPDVAVERTEEDVAGGRDPQFDRALQLLQDAVQ